MLCAFLRFVSNLVNIYSGLQDKIDVYKGHLKEEDRMRKEHPQFFVDPADL